MDNMDNKEEIVCICVNCGKEYETIVDIETGNIEKEFCSDICEIEFLQLDLFN